MRGGRAGRKWWGGGGGRQEGRGQGVGGSDGGEGVVNSGEGDREW